LTTILEAAAIPNGGNKGGSGHRSDAFNFPKPLAQLASAVQLSDPPITGCDPAIELPPNFHITPDIDAISFTPR